MVPYDSYHTHFTITINIMELHAATGWDTLKVHMSARLYDGISAVCQVALLLLWLLLLHDAMMAVRDCIAYAQKISKAESGNVTEQAADISFVHARFSVCEASTDLLERVLELHVYPGVVICLLLLAVCPNSVHTLAVHCRKDVCNS